PATTPRRGCPAAGSAKHLPVARRATADDVLPDPHPPLESAEPLARWQSIGRLNLRERLATESDENGPARALHLFKGCQGVGFNLRHLQRLHGRRMIT